jgi:hypothetical protein
MKTLETSVDAERQDTNFLHRCKSAELASKRLEVKSRESKTARHDWQDPEETNLPIERMANVVAMERERRSSFLTRILQLRRPPEAHLDWGMKTPGGRFCFNFTGSDALAFSLEESS